MIINKNNNRLIYILLFCTFVTSSFDIFLTLDIGGFTFRISQIFCFVLLVIYLGIIIKNRKIVMPIGIKSAIIWGVILILCTFNTILPSINIAYHLWLVFDIAIIFCFTQLINDEDKNDKVIKLYIISFFIMAIVGILEFIISICGIEIPYITQWWIQGKLPRINGFSFEPSYYATYLIIGWVMCRVLVENHWREIKHLLIILLTITLAIVLSSSRIGIVLIFLFEICILIKNIIKKTHKKYILTMIILGSIGLLLTIYMLNQDNYRFLLQGTGLNGSSAHSVTEREENLLNVLEVFKESPFIGKGLGGIYAEMANNKGLDVYSVDVQDAASGICVFAEILAASGIFGFIFFMLYIIKLIYLPLKKIKEDIEPKYKAVIKGLIFSLIMELIILQFNQNILRVYVWIHIAIISSYYRFIINKKNG